MGLIGIVGWGEGNKDCRGGIQLPKGDLLARWVGMGGGGGMKMETCFCEF